MVKTSTGRKSAKNYAQAQVMGTGLKQRRESMKNKMIKERANRELETYDAAVDIVCGFLDPDDRSVPPRYEGCDPTTIVHPKAVFNIELKPDVPGQPFAVLATPNLFQPVYTTNMIKGSDSTFKSCRFFDPQNYAADLSDISPPGRLEHDVEFSCRNPINMQLEMATDNRATLNYGYWNQQHELWFNSLGPQVFNVDTQDVPASNARFYANVWYNNYFLNPNNVTATLYLLQSDGSVISRLMETTFLLVNDLCFGQMNFVASTGNGDWTDENGAAVQRPCNVVGFAYDFTTTGTTTCDVVQITYCADFGVALLPCFEFLHPMDLDVADDVERTCERYEVLGTTVLVSYQGSTLNNGGSIAGRNLIKGYVPTKPVSLFYKELASTPDSYNGPLKHGCFSWVLPPDLESFCPRPLHSRQQGPISVVAGVVDDPSVRIVVTVLQKIRCTTVSKMFALVYPPSNVEAYVLAMNFLQQILTACENPNHMAKINKAIALIKKHRSSIVSGARTAMHVAKIVAPALATALA